MGTQDTIGLKLNSDPVIADVAHFEFESETLSVLNEVNTYGTYANVHDSHRSSDKKYPFAFAIKRVCPQHKDNCDWRVSLSKGRVIDIYVSITHWILSTEWKCSKHLEMARTCCIFGGWASESKAESTKVNKCSPLHVDNIRGFLKDDEWKYTHFNCPWWVEHGHQYRDVTEQRDIAVQ